METASPKLPDWESVARVKRAELARMTMEEKFQAYLSIMSFADAMGFLDRPVREPGRSRRTGGAP
ncbi:MAG: hypothetical protein HY875_14660 [Chloroflexi bacterium]|nr:hypothetical protein [Chloroflexota bacterium]